MSYKLFRSKRKSVLLQVKVNEGLIVRAPRFLSVSQIDRLVHEKRLWIQKKQQELQEKERLLEELKSERPKLPNNLVKTVLLKKIRERVKHYAQKHGLTYGAIKITHARSRWGSCSANGNLNFSSKLYHAPEKVVDYVVVHELAHLKQRNHSQKFWAEVSAMMPEWRTQRKWLADEGYTLE